MDSRPAPSDPNYSKSEGQRAFDAYIEARGGVNPDGSPNPPRWDSLGNDIQDAWQVVADTISKPYKDDAINARGRFRF